MKLAERQRIADQYYELLDKPDVTTQEPRFALCIIGLVGAGKSTVLGRICERLPMTRPSGDEVRKLIFDEGLPSADSVTIAAIGELTVERLLKKGYRVAYDNDFANPEIRQRMEEFNKARDIPIVWIRVTASEDFILSKLRNYQHTYLFRDADDAVDTYHRRKALHEKEAVALDAIPYAYTFNTSKPDLDRQVNEAVLAITEAILAPVNR